MNDALLPIGSRLVPMSESEIRSIEQEIGATLPSDYRAFLLKVGASIPNGEGKFTTIVRLPSHITRDGWAAFHSFFGAESEEYDRTNSIAWNLRIYRDRIPAWLLPVAHDGGGNRICIAIAGPERGKIFFWDMRQEMDKDEMIELGASDRHQNIYLIADSFTEFMHRLGV